MTAPDAAKNGEGGHRGGRNAARPEALVVVRRHVTGNTWAVEADRPNLYIVLTRGQPPEEGDVHEAVQTQRGWMLGRRVEVRELPAELAHPEHPELVAEAGDLTGPDVIRVDSRVLVRENTEVAALVRTWRFRDLEAEAAYGAALIQGRNPYPGLRPLLRPQTLDIVREIAGRTAVTLTEAAVRYDDAQKAWRRGIDTARAEVGTLIQGARDELKELGDRKSELDRDVPDLLIREAALRRTVGELTGSETSLRAELAALDRQVREARERNRERERTDLDPRAALRGRGALVDERAALEHAYRLLGSRFETPLPLVLLHVALKHAPFTVLTGPSGAGKTSLVHQYARALGMHVTTVAVQPNWTSVQDLHGYVDPIAGRHYRGTPFSAALQAQVDYAALDDPEAPLDLVLLDEINLSFVEYFLSDYLSAFETEGREVRLATRDEAEKLAEEPFAWLRRTRGQVQVPRSFLIAGTANEDHTTRAFSDKFRDRSAFLYLPPPDVRRALREGGEPEESDVYVSRRAWEAWRAGAAHSEEQRRAVQALAERVAATGLPFSVRVFRRVLKQYADAQHLLEGLGVDQAAGRAYDLALALSVAPKYAPLLVGRGQEPQRQALRDALLGEGAGDLTRQVLDGLWPTPRS